MSKYLQITYEVEIEIADDDKTPPETYVDNITRTIKTQLGGIAIDVSVSDWDVG